MNQSLPRSVFHVLGNKFSDLWARNVFNFDLAVLIRKILCRERGSLKSIHERHYQPIRLVSGCAEVLYETSVVLWAVVICPDGFWNALRHSFSVPFGHQFLGLGGAFFAPLPSVWFRGRRSGFIGRCLAERHHGGADEDSPSCPTMVHRHETTTDRTRSFRWDVCTMFAWFYIQKASRAR
jgi:hypothetical protein